MRPSSSVLCAVVAALAVLAAAACGSEGDPQAGAQRPGDGAVYALSDTGREGEGLFNANCSVCHGMNASGTSQGPTFIDRIYHPGHHPDASFRNAVSNGVTQHHWVFGNMPPVSGVSSEEVDKIICYVRELQRANGIFEGDGFSTVC